jgi:hypothetical protein
MRHKYFPSLLFFAAGTLIYLLILAALFNASVTEICWAFSQALFMRNHNICPAGSINDINVLSWIYLAAIFLVFLCLTVKCFMRLFKYHFFAHMALKDIITQVAFFMVGVLMLIQTANVALSAILDLDRYGNISTEQKYTQILGETYLFARFVQQKLPERASLGYISENKLSESDGMTMHRQLAYLLYPLDMRKIRKEDIDAYIIVRTQDPERLIPEGYSRVEKFDEENIIALKTKQ